MALKKAYNVGDWPETKAPFFADCVGGTFGILRQLQEVNRRQLQVSFDKVHYLSQ